MSAHVLPSVGDGDSSCRSSIYSTRRNPLSDNDVDEEEKCSSLQQHDSKFYDELSQIQQQYNIYEYDFKKNYKSWGSVDKGDLMTSKEYHIIWTWFKDTLNSVNKERESAHKTLVYYTLVNDIFEGHREAVRYFDRMKLSHDDMVASFTHFISVLTDSSLEQSAKLRQHIIDKRRHKKLKGNDNEGSEEDSCRSLPFLRGSHRKPSRDTASPTVSTRINEGDESTSVHFPTISSDSNKSTSSQNGRRGSKSGPHNKITITKTSKAHHTKSVRPGGRMQAMGHMFRRHLSRLTSRSEDEPRRDMEDDDSSRRTAKKRKEKGASKKSNQKKVAMVQEPADDSQGNGTSSKEKPAKLEKSGSIFANIGWNVRKQLNRLTSMSEE